MLPVILAGVERGTPRISTQDAIHVVSEDEIDLVAGLCHVVVSHHGDDVARREHHGSNSHDGGASEQACEI